MKLISKILIASIVASLMSAGSAMAAPLLGLQIQGSTDNGVTWSNTIDASKITSNTIEIRVIGQMIMGATNAVGTISTFNNTIDGIIGASFSLSDDNTSAVFSNLALVYPYNTGASALPGTIANNNVTKIRPIETGFPGYGTTSAAVLLTGTLNVGTATGTETISGAFDTYTSGSIKFNGGTTKAFTTTTETGSDPIVSYSSLTISPAPEPASLSVLALGAVGLLARRRRA